MQKGVPGRVHGAAHQIMTCGSKLWPRFRGHKGTARVALPAMCYQFVPLSPVPSGFWIWAPSFHRFTPKVNRNICRL